MTIADLSSIRFAVWQDMKTELLGTANADINYLTPAYYTGPGADLGFDNAGSGGWARAVSYAPTLPTQGAMICRVRMLFGSQNKSWLCLNGASFQTVLGWGGSSFIVNGSFVSGFNDVADTWRVLVGTWGPAGIKAYDNGALFGSSPSIISPNAVAYGLSVGAGFSGVAENTAYNNLGYLKMDFAAILSRQLSDAEVLDLSTNYTALWAASGGVNKRQAKLGAKRTGLACGGL